MEEFMTDSYCWLWVEVQSTVGLWAFAWGKCLIAPEGGKMIQSEGKGNVALSTRTAEMEKFKLEEATIGEIHRAMKSGQLTCRRLVEMYLARIEAYDQKGPALNSIILVNRNALRTAEELDKKFQNSGFVGPLHGIPVLLKDNIDTSDLFTTGGSLSLRNSLPPNDAFLVKRLREAGAVILGKTNLHEFAAAGVTISSILGQTLNPYDLTRTPGGSSGGTGAAVAANFGSVGIGTDTVNSVRSPASANSIVGIKPTLGLVSRNGIIPLALTQDTAGPMTRTVTDAAKLLDIIAGYDPKDPVTAWSAGQVPQYAAFLDSEGLKSARIGMLEAFFGSGLDHQEVNAVCKMAIAEMQNQGAVMIPVKEPVDDVDLISNVSVHHLELNPQLHDYLKTLGSNAPVKSIEDILISGNFHSSIEEVLKKNRTSHTDDDAYKERLLKRLEVQQKVMKMMADYQLDALVYPHQKRLVVPIGQDQVERNGVLGAVTGFPAITVPAGFSSPAKFAPIGVPIGIEFLGRPWSEPMLIKVAYAFEQATKFRRPPINVPPSEIIT
jgi:Asp-tRNA(Asn)/Glu-tRNA(Gln) amidotransferase A subunit family amidase